MPRENWQLTDFDYHLPAGLIAQYPAARRDKSRLLVLQREKQRIIHQNFSGLIDYLSCGDCLVLNNTRVIWARMIGRRETLAGNRGGGRQEIFLLGKLNDGSWQVLAKPANKLPPGAKVFFNEGSLWAEVLEGHGALKIIKFSGNDRGDDFWREGGQVPLPPYIKRKAEAIDQQRYQTVYAREEGSCAAPTAGLHFTEELLASIRKKGVRIVYVTLHINYGTFAPVKCADIREHQMHKEYYTLPSETAKALNTVRREGKKIFAVGTTSARVLETCANKSAPDEPVFKEDKGWTDLFIYPPYKFKAVDCLLTNFHFPKSTLLMLVSAFAGRKLLLKAYQEAIERQYRFFSYGDAMLVM